MPRTWSRSQPRTVSACPGTPGALFTAPPHTLTVAWVPPQLLQGPARRSTPKRASHSSTAITSATTLTTTVAVTQLQKSKTRSSPLSVAAEGLSRFPPRRPSSSTDSLLLIGWMTALTGNPNLYLTCGLPWNKRHLYG